MRIDIITLFPEMVEAFLGESIIGRARKDNKIEINCHQLRDFSDNKWRRVDDTSYGGGMGLVIRCEPLARCTEHVISLFPEKPHVIYFSPKGRVFNQQVAIELKEQHENLLFVCGHYEGVDQRYLDKYVDEEISIGDYVLTGGEIAAVAVADAVARLCPGVLSSDECFEEESHYGGLLEYPQYSKPSNWEGMEVPEILLSGNHEKIARWRRDQALIITKERRPDMFEKIVPDKKDLKSVGWLWKKSGR